MQYMPTLLEVLKILAPLVFGVILGYLGYRYQMSSGKVNLKRNRLLDNIAKFEQILSVIKDTEFEFYRLEALNLEEDRKNKRIDEITERLRIISENFARLRSRGDELKIRFEKLNKLRSDIAATTEEHDDNNEKSLETKSELDEMEKGLLQDKKDILLENEQYINQMSEYKKEMEDNIKVIENTIIKRDKFNKTGDDLLRKLYLLDPDTVSLTIDPTGKLTSKLSELVSMLKLGEKSTYVQIVGKRVEIERLLSKIINKS